MDIVGSYDDINGYCYTCGVYRRVMIEFYNPCEFKIIVVKYIKDYKKIFTK